MIKTLRSLLLEDPADMNTGRTLKQLAKLEAVHARV